MRPVVVSVGGSILADAPERPTFLRDLAACLRDVSRRSRLLVTAGGGPTARAYIAAGRALRIPEKALDLVGIRATRLNAQLLAAALGRTANPEIPATERAALRLSTKHPITVMGGTSPGWTTDAVAVRLAVMAKASHLVNATSVDGVYTADPKRDPSARRLDRVTFRDLVRLVGTKHERAGPNVVFDPVAAKLVARHRLPVYVVDGRDLRNLRAALLDKPFRGTRVGP